MNLRICWLRSSGNGVLSGGPLEKKRKGRRKSDSGKKLGSTFHPILSLSLSLSAETHEDRKSHIG
jgi:hypothetical protein